MVSEVWQDSGPILRIFVLRATEKSFTPSHCPARAFQTNLLLLLYSITNKKSRAVPPCITMKTLRTILTILVLALVAHVADAFLWKFRCVGTRFTQTTTDGLKNLHGSMSHNCFFIVETTGFANAQRCGFLGLGFKMYDKGTLGFCFQRDECIYFPFLTPFYCTSACSSEP